MPINAKDDERLHGYNSRLRSRKTFTKVEIRQALQDAAVGHDGPLARTSYQSYYEENPGLPHSYTIIRRYDKWNDALKDAGLPTTKRSAYKSRINDYDCVKALLRARDILGHLPSGGEYSALWKYGTPDGVHGPLKGDGLPSGSTVRVKFGKWRDAVTEASRYIDKSVCQVCKEPATGPLCSNCR